MKVVVAVIIVIAKLWYVLSSIKWRIAKECCKCWC